MAEVIRDVMPGDPMYKWSPELYWEVGEKAVSLIRDAVEAAEISAVETVLDFGCGAGRVMRFLRAEYPDAVLTGVDIRQPGLTFCAKSFGAKVIRSGPDLAKVTLDGSYDVIWCGSLLTHVNLRNWLAALRLWRPILSGVLLFTTLGPNAAAGIRNGSLVDDLVGEERESILADYERDGFGFVPNLLKELDYGECLAAPDWTKQRLEEAGFELLSYREAAWVGQDVV